MRVLFWPSRISVLPSAAPLQTKVGMPLAVTSTMEGIIAEAHGVSRNPGNLVHVEAPSRTFSVNRTLSCFGNWTGGRDEAKGLDAEAARVNAGFDAACFSFANVIRAFRDMDTEQQRTSMATLAHLAAIILRLEIPVYVFGVGLQDDLPVDRDVIPPELLSLLVAINEKARLFGVRGETTERWLHGIGLTRARALGCPSLFVYPRNVLAIRAPELTASSRIGVAGRLQPHRNGTERAIPLRTIGEAFQADYVFQNDLQSLLRGFQDRPIYDDATGLLDGDFMREITERRVGFRSPFRGHYFFRDTSRWRMFAHLHDAYVGDRFHGGVVFLQAARPALILQADARVRELTGFLGIPTLPVTDLVEGRVAERVAAALSPEAIGHFHETYRRRLRAYAEACEEAGLTFADRPAVAEALGEAVPPMPAAIPPRRPPEARAAALARRQARSGA